MVSEKISASLLLGANDETWTWSIWVRVLNLNAIVNGLPMSQNHQTHHRYFNLNIFGGFGYPKITSMDPKMSCSQSKNTKTSRSSMGAMEDLVRRVWFAGEHQENRVHGTWPVVRQHHWSHWTRPRWSNPIQEPCLAHVFSWCVLSRHPNTNQCHLYEIVPGYWSPVWPQNAKLPQGYKRVVPPVDLYGT